MAEVLGGPGSSGVPAQEAFRRRHTSKNLQNRRTHAKQSSTSWSRCQRSVPAPSSPRPSPYFTLTLSNSTYIYLQTWTRGVFSWSGSERVAGHVAIREINRTGRTNSVVLFQRLNVLMCSLWNRTGRGLVLWFSWWKIKNKLNATRVNGLFCCWFSFKKHFA